MVERDCETQNDCPLGLQFGDFVKVSSVEVGVGLVRKQGKGHQEQVVFKEQIKYIRARGAGRTVMETKVGCPLAQVQGLGANEGLQCLPMEKSQASEDFILSPIAGHCPSVSGTV